HPFVEAALRSLGHAQDVLEAIPGTEVFRRKQAEQFKRDNQAMRDLVDKIVQERRASGDTSTDDLLGRMLNTPDPVTGEL
ncbi:hypothetical protein GTW59_27405, partial [Streptomyces sp. SID89]|nr:hypothetical protein [Streptomyces sp. SID89]